MLYISSINVKKSDSVKKINFYGSRIFPYIVLTIFGLGLLLSGIIVLLISGTRGSVVGVMYLLFGGLFALGGWVGYRDEIKKYGMIRKYTSWGYVALILALAGLFAAPIKYLPIIIGILAIIFGIKAYKLGDLEFGEVGIGGGLICVILGFILIPFFQYAESVQI